MLKVNPEKLKGKVIDAHSHTGVHLRNYISADYPYAETAESLYFKQKAGGVDVNVVFPYSSELYGDLNFLADNSVLKPSENPISKLPYEIENALLLKEIYNYCPELSEHFLPFISIDPGKDRKVPEQLANMRALCEKWPVYGIKINPAVTFSHVTDINLFPEFFDFAVEYDLPILFHCTSIRKEGFSWAGDMLEIAGKHEDLRFCLAHSITFHEELLRKADSMPNVWVDTSALKIQIQLVREMIIPEYGKDELIDTDFNDHIKTMRYLSETFPDTILWATDSASYSYFSKRATADGSVTTFNYKGSYMDEVNALNSLPEEMKRKVSNLNTLNFIFGKN